MLAFYWEHTLDKLTKSFLKKSFGLLCGAMSLGFVYGVVLRIIYLDEYQVWQSKPWALFMTFIVLMSSVLGCWIGHLFTRGLEKKITSVLLESVPSKE